MAYSDHVRGERGALQQASFSVGGALGVVAYFVGFVTTYVLKVGSVDTPPWAPGSVNETQLISYLFYGMHQVDIVVTVSQGGASEAQTFAMSSLPVWDNWLQLIPPAVLVVVGLVAALAAGADDMGGRILSGASIFVGYLACMLAGYGLFGTERTSFGSTVTIGPDLLSSVLTAGIIYPVLFGSIGGVIGSIYFVDST